MLAGLNIECAANFLGAIRHDAQAEARAPGSFRREPDAIVGYAQHRPVARSAQQDADAVSLAMFHSVVDGFLRQTEEMCGGVSVINA